MILEWGRHNRRDMAWRDTRDPYKILVSEVMLQQTQVSRVLPKYETLPPRVPHAGSPRLLLPVQSPPHMAGTRLLEPCPPPPGRRPHGRQRVRRTIPAGPHHPEETPRRRTIHCRCRRLLRVRERGAVPRHQHPACLPVLLLPRGGRRFRQSHHGNRAPGRLDRRPSASGATPSSTTARPSPATGRSTVAADTTPGRAPLRDRSAPSAPRPSATSSPKKTPLSHGWSLSSSSEPCLRTGIFPIPRRKWSPPSYRTVSSGIPPTMSCLCDHIRLPLMRFPLR